MTADEFNSKYRIGSAVTYLPVNGNGRRVIKTYTRDEAWESHDGRGFVAIIGRALDVPLNSISIDTDRRPMPEGYFDPASRLPAEEALERRFAA